MYVCYWGLNSKKDVNLKKLKKRIRDSKDDIAPIFVRSFLYTSSILPLESLTQSKPF
jgi:hypothetical protein